MSGGGGSSNTTTSTKVELPAWHQPYVQAIDNQAYNFSQQPYEQYQGTRIAPMTAEQNAGLDMTAMRGLYNPLSNAASDEATKTIRGDYLNPLANPSWGPLSDQITKTYQNGIAAQTDSAFSRAGAFGMGNSAYDQTVQANQRGYADSLNKLAGDIYNSERGNQMQALSMYPQINAGVYGDYQNLTGVGDARRQYGQDIANLGYQDWSEARNYPYTQMQNYANLTPALLGNSQSTSSTGPNPYKSSPMANAIGGATGGYALASMLPAAMGINPLFGAALGIGAGMLM